jgi:hypothetical protein
VVHSGLQMQRYRLISSNSFTDGLWYHQCWLNIQIRISSYGDDGRVLLLCPGQISLKDCYTIQGDNPTGELTFSMNEKNLSKQGVMPLRMKGSGKIWMDDINDMPGAFQWSSIW